MRKLLKAVLLGASAVCCTFALASCSRGNEPESEHVCTWRTVTEATCTQNGRRERTCNCGNTGGEEIEKLGHHWVDDKDEAEHWQRCDRTGCTAEQNREEHSYGGDGSCACGAKRADKNKVTAVEWNKAVAVISDHTESIAFEAVMSSSDRNVSISFKYDMRNESAYIMYGTNVMYYWKDGDKYYCGYEGNPQLEEHTQEDFDEFLKINLYGYGGYALVLKDKFDAFTYNETTKEYTATSFEGTGGYGEGNVPLGDYTVKFENGKIVKLEESFGGDMTLKADYSYGDSVTYTVPDEIKNLS